MDARTKYSNVHDTIPYLGTLPTKELDTAIIVSSTRNQQRIENSPLKVEVLGREEMDEESGIKPAGIGSILGDISGVQIQQSSVVNGNANVRIQGLAGRYTQILRDGLPMYEGFSGGFGILSMPPLDLRQVELIKGSASTLYGGGAIGGLVNIISRVPTSRQEFVISFNQTTLKETNLNTYLSKRNKWIGYTLFAGNNRQQPVDVNRDGFSDLAKWRGWVIHPRVHLYLPAKTTLTLGFNGSWENRKGGDMLVIQGRPDAIHSFFESNKTNRTGWEWIFEKSLTGGSKLQWKGCYGNFDRGIQDRTDLFSGRQENGYTELSYYLPHGAHHWVTGINWLGDRFRRMSSNIPIDRLVNSTWGVFIQDTWNLSEQTILETGIRSDQHMTYGNFLLPRVALFHRFNNHWATRLGYGAGYKIPCPFAAQNTDIPIQLIQPVRVGTNAEKSSGYNLELNYKWSGEGQNNVFINQAFFLTSIQNPLVVKPDNLGNVFFENEHKPIVTKGTDTYIQIQLEDWELYAGYTFTIAERTYLSSQQFIPLTPKNRLAATAVWEWENKGIRVGLESSYTGSQFREDGSRTPGYLFLAAMIQKKIGKHLSLVLNVENLGDARQSRTEALYDGSITNPIFRPLWGPIDGRVFNLSMKWSK